MTLQKSDLELRLTPPDKWFNKMQKFSNNRKKYFPTVEDIEFSVESFKKCRVLSRGHSWDLPEKAKLFAGAQYEVGLVINACTSQELNPVILLPMTMTCHILTSN